jgi:hypothetical protein
MEKFIKDYSTIFNEKTLNFSVFLALDTKSDCRLIIRTDINDLKHADISDLNLKLKITRKLLDEYRKILSLKIDWDVEEKRQIRNEVINIVKKLHLLYRALKCFFNALSINKLVKSSKLKITLSRTRKISARNDSYFKCILGHYRGKYRRITIASDMSFINASSVCGGED